MWLSLGEHLSRLYASRQKDFANLFSTLGTLGDRRLLAPRQDESPISAIRLRHEVLLKLSTIIVIIIIIG